MNGNSLRALPEQCQVCEEDGNDAVVGGLGDHGDEVNAQLKQSNCEIIPGSWNSWKRGD